MKHETVPEVVQALLDARALVAVGWSQGWDWKRDDDGCCALQALFRVTRRAPGSVGLGHPYSAATHYLQKALGQGKKSVIAFNDAPTTTKADVLALYDRAIALALAE
jgi:hypothetical protein